MSDYIPLNAVDKIDLERVYVEFFTDEDWRVGNFSDPKKSDSPPPQEKSIQP